MYSTLAQYCAIQTILYNRACKLLAGYIMNNLSAMEDMPACEADYYA